MKKIVRPAKRTGKVRRNSKSGKFTIGAERFAKISAVEGITLTMAMQTRQEEFKTKRLSPASRRAAIIRAYRKG